MRAGTKRKKRFAKKDTYQEKKQLLRGKFSGNINGYGFVAREDNVQPDVFIPADKTCGAITGDIVEFYLLPGGLRGPSGIIVSILARTVKELTGILLSERSLQVLDSRFPNRIKLKGSLKGGKKGDWLKVKVLSDKEDIKDAGKKKRGRKNPDGSIAFPALAGEVVEKIGKAGDIAGDLLAVASQYGISEPYSEAEEAAAMRIRPREMTGGRKDMTKAFSLTIDPGDAKDFDDALSIENGRKKGEILLGVHIADVAAFIRPGSRFDKGADKRGFSCYMPGMFRPMLPKGLTAKMSLQEKVESKAHTILFTVRKEDGKILSHKRFHSLLKIRKRLDYDSVQAFLDDPSCHPRDWNKTLLQKLSLLAEIAKKMRENRKREEMYLNIETREVRAIVDMEEKKVASLQREQQRDSELLVEEFMLAANCAAASEMILNKIPGLFRIHAEPSREKIMEFMEMLRHSFNIRTGDLTFRKDCSRFLDSLPGDARSGIIFSSFLRSLPRASYSCGPDLHYGLGKMQYTHFTSPIRRYPDLLIHQQLWAYDEKKKLYSDEFFQKKAEECTSKEFQSDEAYFAANDRMKLHFLLDNGVLEESSVQAFEGIIAKVSASGILCDIPELGIYGFVPMKYLETRMRYRSREGRYRAEKGRGGYKTGNYIYLVVDRIDLAAGKAFFRPVS